MCKHHELKSRATLICENVFCMQSTESVYSLSLQQPKYNFKTEFVHLELSVLMFAKATIAKYAPIITKILNRPF